MDLTRFPVGIAAVAAWTPLGRSAAASAAAVRAGISRLGDHPFMVDREGEPFCVATDADIDAVGQLARCSALLRGVLEQVVPALRQLRVAKLHVYLAVPSRLGRDTVRLVAIVRELCGPTIDVSTVAADHASGLLGLELAHAEINARKLEAALVLGVDSYIDADVLEEFDRDGINLATHHRFGFPPGEGAGAVLLAPPALIRTNRLTVIAAVEGVGSADEPKHHGTEGINTGEALAKAINGATKTLRIPDDLVGTIYCDINGQRHRAAEYAWSTQRVRPVFENMSDFVTPADSWGDVGAASGPLLVSLAVASGVRRYALRNRSLVFACSPTRQRAAALIHHASLGEP